MCSLAVRTAASNSSRDVRASTIGGSPPPVVARDRPPRQLALEELDARAGELVERFEALARRHARVGDQQDAVPHVIEGEHRVEQHERRFAGRIAEAAALALPHAVERRLEPRRGVVAEEADGAAGQARQVGHDRRAVLGHHPAQRVDERLVRGPRSRRRARGRPGRCAPAARGRDPCRGSCSGRCARRLRRSPAGRRSRRARRP